MKLNINSFTEDLDTQSRISFLMEMKDYAEALSEELDDIIQELCNIESAESTYTMSSTNPKCPAMYHTEVDDTVNTLVKYRNTVFNNISVSGEVIC